MWSEFEEEKILGNGAFGTVYRVRSKKTKKLYAVKKQPLKSDVMMNEVKLLRKLPQTRNVIAFHGFWVENQNGYILMEYASEGSLDGILKQSTKPIPEKVAFHYFSQIVLGINHIHRQKIIHGDLKPANVMVHRVNRGPEEFMDVIKIGDFGVAKETKRFLVTGARGDIHYTAPEIFEQTAYGYKCDMWSCGIILYELLTNKYPFAASTEVELMEKIRGGRVTPITTENISQSAVDLTYSLLNVDPQKRPRSSDLLRHPNIERCNEKISSFLNDTEGDKRSPYLSLESGTQYFPGLFSTIFCSMIALILVVFIIYLVVFNRNHSQTSSGCMAGLQKHFTGEKNIYN